jgi:alpha-tubulin suppressor-like RCC1 family protein
VYIWGRGDFGQLGNGSDTNAWVPQRSEQLEGKNVVLSCSSVFHSAFLTGLCSEGTTAAWQRHCSTVLVAASLLRTADAEGYARELDQQWQRRLDQLSALGARRSRTLRSHASSVVLLGSSRLTSLCAGDGELLTSGNNDSGQLGCRGRQGALEPTRVDALGTQRIVAAACGQAHTAAVTDQVCVCVCIPRSSAHSYFHSCSMPPWFCPTT